MFKKITTLLLVLTPMLYADYESAMEKYEEKSYEAAIFMLEEAAQNGDKRAQYQLGNIFEHGLAGVKKDDSIAICYYKMVASNYNYCEVEPLAKDASVLDHLSAQQGSLTDKKLEHYLTSKLDTQSPQEQEALAQVISSDFGLYAYRTNYFLPFSQADEKYPVWNDSGIVPGAEHEHKTEAVFQISLKKPLSFDLLGLNEAFVFAYTQQVWWQLYSFSEPFREMSFEPEFFMTLPTTLAIDEATGLKAMKFGFIHQSNGQDNARSRTWNRLYIATLWQHGQLFTNLRAWYKTPETAEDDHAHDIHKYMGYGDLNFNYLYKKNQIGLLLRNNLDFGGENKGAVKVDWSYPFFNAHSVYWYLEYFNGYGESLIDYNRRVKKVGAGLSFSRNLF